MNKKSTLNIISNPLVKEKFKSYPTHVRPKMNALRQLIIETAKGIEGLNELEETLKWAEPSYLVKKGSTIRMDWKEKSPEQYAMYFNCTSQLVHTFRLLYQDKLSYEKNRAVIFSLNESIPADIIKECISMALRYHQIKHLPRLGY